ncbi:MAG: AAA family ATPase [Phycisphaerales bacterium JB060]
MLTNIAIRNFKRLDEATFDLGQAVVLIGPNNSGKTTALQALALWDLGLRAWRSKRGGKDSPTKRPGVTINRRDLFAVPTPTANLLWHGLKTHQSVAEGDKSRTIQRRIEIIVEGVTSDASWTCGFEFDYSNPESLNCRPVRQPGFETARVADAEFTEVSDDIGDARVAFLPPMSGLADREFVKQQGEIAFLIGQGQTAQVLRNLCLQIHNESPDNWKKITQRIDRVFGCRLKPPRLIDARSEIEMEYEERDMLLDISSAGRGLQQTLLLLAHLYSNPGSILLLDEPDAHLEILRQRQTYHIITKVAREVGSQIIAASHSEVVLNEAADRDIVIAFVGAPHRMDDRGSQVLKSLREVGFDQYYQAELRGWVLYLEGSTDLAILRAFAERLSHPALEHLHRPFVHYVANSAKASLRHFHAVREAKPDLVGVAVFDRGGSPRRDIERFTMLKWERREIENYVCQPETLIRYAHGDDEEGLFGTLMRDRRVTLMQRLLDDRIPPIAMRDREDEWWHRMKATDELLDPLFDQYFKELKMPHMMRKSGYYQLAHLVQDDHLASEEIAKKLDAIVQTANKANPKT